MPRIERDIAIVGGGISSAIRAQKLGELRKGSSKTPSEHP